MEKDLNIFIIWHNARHKEREIIKDISKNFDILQVFRVNWSKEKFPKNLSRFYGKNIIKTIKKSKQVGTNEFTLIVVYDNFPYYEGSKNKNILSAKAKYRKLTGGGHLIHASDNNKEAEENLLLLLGLNIESFEKIYPYPWNGNIIKINNDIVATNGWSSDISLKKFLEKIDDCYLKKNNIKTNNVSKLCRLINATSILSFINLYKININGNKKFVWINKAPKY